MLTMISNMAGLGIPMAAGLLVGGAMGFFGVREDRKKALEKRRTDAKAGVRKYVDDFINQVGKDSRDSIRHVQRELRTAWTARVAELQRVVRRGARGRAVRRPGGQDRHRGPRAHREGPRVARPRAGPRRRPGGAPPAHRSGAGPS